MTEAERKRLIALPIVLLVLAGLAWAGSAGGTMVAGIPLFALCVAIAVGIQWIVFVPSYLARTEHFYDLTGSLTYLTVMAVAVTGSGLAGPRAMLLAALVAVWAIRLGSFLFLRVRADGGDGRFDEIKKSGLRFFVAWTLQGLWVSITGGAALAAITSGRAGALDLFAWIGLGVWIAGFGLEVVADRQKGAFKADPQNKGRFITTGVWAWSRHPNYFGEIVLWVGIAVIAFPALQGPQYVTLVSPLFTYLLITRVSGVNLLEARADERWGDDPEYRAYRATTPVLVPRPPR